MEEFRAQKFPLLLKAAHRYAKQRPPTPAAAGRTQLAALTLTQLSLLGIHGPWPECVACVASSGSAMETPAPGSGLCHGF